MPFEPSFDPISPSHYSFGGIECIEALEACSSTEGFRAHLKLSAMAYLWRYEKKGGLEDVRKAKWYLNTLIHALEMDEEKEALDAIENNVECTDGFCPMPGIRYDLPGKQVLFDPVEKS